MRTRAKTPVNRGQMNISSGTSLSFSGTAYEKIVGNWVDGCSNNFSIDDVNDRLIYNGTQSICCVMNGVSDIKVDKACEITYALYKNGELVTGAETPHSFSSASKYSTISITTLITVNPGDYFEAWAKSDDATVTLTINSLKILFFGEN